MMSGWLVAFIAFAVGLVVGLCVQLDEPAALDEKPEPEGPR